MKISELGHFSSLIKGKTVSIVGNAGKLLQAPYGALIDEADVVIRFNLAETTNYEKHVGTRTDIRVSNNHFLNALDSPQKKEYFRSVFSGFDPDFFLKIKNELVVIKEGGLTSALQLRFIEQMKQDNKIDFLTTSFVCHCGSIIKKLPSCGCLGIMAALPHAASIKCFGFNFYECSQGDKHYYEASSQDGHGCHDFQSEKNFITNLNLTQQIELY